MSNASTRAERARDALRLLETALADAGVAVPKPELRLSVPNRSPFEAAVIADALAVVDVDPSKPAAADVRIYLRRGRRYTRVFWTLDELGDDGGSILHFVENATGQVFAAKSSKKVGRRLSRVVEIDRSASAESPRPRQPKASSSDLRALLRRSADLTPQKVMGLLGMPIAELSRDERRSGVKVRKHDRHSVSIEWIDWEGQGERIRAARFDQAIEKLRAAGYGFFLLSGEVGEAAIVEGRERGIVLVHLPLAAAKARRAPKAAKPVEVWERDRVVWYRPIDAGHRERRVELRRGDTAWMSFGTSNVRKGVWGSVNGISKARRQIRVDRQWVALPLVYARDEVEGLSGLRPPPAVRDPATESDFGRLLDGLRRRSLRKLRIVSTDASPHDMRVDRVVSHPGVVVAEGLIKKSKARLTVHADTDDRGRPTKYARLRRGSREYRVDARRITAPGSAKSSAAEEKNKPAAPTARRRETEHQRERRERAERKAERLRRRAEAQHEGARAELAGIPMGQPILVGHHSERRHRKAIERSDRKTRQALETSRAAEQATAASTRAGHAISSDDPEALGALEARLADLEASRELSKAINAAYRKGGWPAVERVDGVTPAVLAKAKRTMGLAHWLKAPMDVKNLGGNIRRVRKRIEELKAVAEREAAPAIEGDGFRITEHPDDNRIRFIFAKRPSKDVTSKMKRAGFRWSRKNGAWQRQLNNAGRHAAERMAKKLFGFDAAEARRQGEWQQAAKADRERALERQRAKASSKVLSDAEWDAKMRERAGITSADLATFPADVIEEAEATGRRPERVLELREMSRREEEEMGRKLRRAAREEEAAYRCEREER